METATNISQPPTGSPSSVPQKKNSKTPVFVALAILVILVLAAIIYFLFFSNKKSNTQTQQEKVATSSAQTETTDTESEKVYVTALEGLNLREEASTESLIKLLLPNGTELKVISTQGDWYFVEAQTKGFVKAEFVSDTKPTDTVLLTFENNQSPFKFLYPHLYKITLTKADNITTYSFTGNESYGGFKVESSENFATLGNYAIKNYPQAQRGSCEPIRFGTQTKECEKVTDSSGTTYLLLVNTTLYKISYLKTEGGLLTDINNLVFYSMYFD